MHGRSPTSNFGGTVPPVPLGLRPCCDLSSALLSSACDLSSALLSSACALSSALLSSACDLSSALLSSSCVLSSACDLSSAFARSRPPIQTRHRGDDGATALRLFGTCDRRPVAPSSDRRHRNRPNKGAEHLGDVDQGLCLNNNAVGIFADTRPHLARRRTENRFLSPFIDRGACPGPGDRLPRPIQIDQPGNPLKANRRAPVLPTFGARHTHRRPRLGIYIDGWHSPVALQAADGAVCVTRIVHA